jgi:hypothetical protein
MTLETPSNPPQKAVTSLLLYSIISKKDCDLYLVRCEKLIRSQQYGHGVPPLVRQLIGESDVKCSFDFTSQLRDDLSYHAALSEFLKTHDQFICNLLSLDSSLPLYLSALLNVDQNLAVFEVKIPRIPDAINSFHTFEFDYSVWHPREELLDE